MISRYIWKKIKKEGIVLNYYDEPQLIQWKDYLILLVECNKWLVFFKPNKKEDQEALDLREIILRSVSKNLVEETDDTIWIKDLKFSGIPNEFLPDSGFFLKQLL